MKEESPLSTLLDSIYELEGLVHIALNRENPPAVLTSLIKRKAETVAGMAKEIVLPESPENDRVYAQSPFPPELVDAAEEEVIPMETVSPDYPLGDEYSGSRMSEVAGLVSESVESDVISSGVIVPEERGERGNREEKREEKEAREAREEKEERNAAPALPDEYVSDDEYEESVDSELSSYVLPDEVAAEPAVAQPATPQPRGKGKPAFNLNDRYRFRRTLFNGSDSEYQGALSVLAGMNSYSEAEAYFLDTLGWNLENEEVKDFMSLLENWFQ